MSSYNSAAWDKFIEPVGQFCFDYPMVPIASVVIVIFVVIGALVPEIKNYEPKYKSGDIVYHKYSNAKGLVVRRGSCPSRSNQCSAKVRFTDTSHEAVWINEWELSSTPQ